MHAAARLFLVGIAIERWIWRDWRRGLIVHGLFVALVLSY